MIHKRIEDIAAQAGMSFDKYVLAFANVAHEEGVDLDKFAELLIKGCARVAPALAEVPASEPRHCAQDILIHFGLE